MDKDGARVAVKAGVPDVLVRASCMDQNILTCPGTCSALTTSISTR